MCCMPSARQERGWKWGTALPSVCDRTKLIPPPFLTHIHTYMCTRFSYLPLAYTHTSQPCHSRWWRGEVWAVLGSVLHRQLSRDWHAVIKISGIQISFFPSLLYLTCFFVSLCPAECDKLRKDGFRSSQYYSQGPTFADPDQSTSSLQDDEEDENDKKVHMHGKSPLIHTVFKVISFCVCTQQEQQLFGELWLNAASAPWQHTSKYFYSIRLPSSGQLKECFCDVQVYTLTCPLYWYYGFIC